MTNLVDGSFLGNSQLAVLVKSLFLKKVADLVSRRQKVLISNVLVIL